MIDVGHDRAKPKAAEQGAKPEQVTPKQGAAAPAGAPRAATCRRGGASRRPRPCPVKDAAPRRHLGVPPPAKPAAAAAPRPMAPRRRSSQPPRLRRRKSAAAAGRSGGKRAAAGSPPPKEQCRQRRGCTGTSGQRAEAAAVAAPQHPAKPRRPSTSCRRPIRTRPSSSMCASPATILRAEFPFAVETPAAVFQRADTLWLVFDSAAKIDIAALTRRHQPVIRAAALEHGADGEAIVRIKLERPRLVSLETDGPGWIVTIGDTAAVPSRSARHRPQHRQQEPRQPLHSVRSSEPRSTHRRPRYRRPAAGDHRARARARHS